MSLLANYIFFLLKTLTFVAAILFTFAGLLALTKIKNKPNHRIKIKYLNDRYEDILEELQKKTLSSEQLKSENKKRKKLLDNLKQKNRKKIFYLKFNGDMQASEVESLREKITAILTIATNRDEVVLNIESPGGVVHAYGLCGSQLARLREHNIPLTVIIDKVAASGGYLMASVANQIIAAPFAIVGSIGVVAQLPNFHRFLKKHNVDFEQITAGEYKRTLTYFGENTPKAREKFQEEIDNAHQLFKKFIIQYRPQLNIEEVASGEFWFGSDAIALKLIDKIGTSDDYLLQAVQSSDIYEIHYQTPLSLVQKLSRTISQSLSLRRSPFDNL